MKCQSKFSSILFMLILMFLVFFVTACDGTQTEGNRNGENKNEI